MYTYKATESNVKKEEIPAALTYAEIQKEEGVYQSTDHLTKEDRIIVLKQPAGISVVLFYGTKSLNLEKAADHWDSHTFIKTNEKFIFGLKPK